MSFCKDTIPKTPEAWLELLVERLKLTTGHVGPFGPNILQLLKVQAESLHVQNQLHQELMESLKKLT